jgi:hypothetical protein
MNIPTTGAPRPTSRFVEHLHSIADGGGRGRVGFRAQAAAPKRTVGVVASLQQADPSLLRRLAQEDIDAVEVNVADRAGAHSLKEVVDAFEKPVGIATQVEVDDELAAALVESGIDWARLTLDAPWLALGWERPSRFLTVPIDVDLRISGALNAPFVEAVVLVPSGDGWSQQLSEALRLRTISEIVKRPIVAAVPASAPALSAEVYGALGIDAVLIEVDGPAAIERLAAHAARLQATAHSRHAEI